MGNGESRGGKGGKSIADSPLKIQRDTLGQPFIEWHQGCGGYKRAWIQRRNPENDWAKALDRRYLNVARIEEPGGGPAGNATDFPVFSRLSDEQLLLTFVLCVSAITGLSLKQDRKWKL